MSQPPRKKGPGAAVTAPKGKDKAKRQVSITSASFMSRFPHIVDPHLPNNEHTAAVKQKVIGQRVIVKGDFWNLPEESHPQSRRGAAVTDRSRCSPP